MTSLTFTYMLWSALSASKLKVIVVFGLILVNGKALSILSPFFYIYDLNVVKCLGRTSNKWISGAIEYSVSCLIIWGSSSGYYKLGGWSLRIELIIAFAFSSLIFDETSSAFRTSSWPYTLVYCLLMEEEELFLLKELYQNTPSRAMAPAIPNPRTLFD